MAYMKNKINDKYIDNIKKEMDKNYINNINPSLIKSIKEIDKKYIDDIDPSFIKSLKEFHNIIEVGYNQPNNLQEIKKINKKEPNSKSKTSKMEESFDYNGQVPFEKVKFIKATFFMKIGNLIGISIRNKYYANLDNEVKKALEKNEIYRVLEAQKNGYFLGKEFENLVLEKLHNELTNNPILLINELVKRDILLSEYNLSLVLLSSKGKELIMNINPEENPYAKKLYADLLNKETFLHENKKVWLKSTKDIEQFLKEDNPLFYHEKMLSICEKSELIGVKKAVEKFLQDKEVLKSISKNKLIDSMLLKLDMQLGNSINLDNVVLDLPKVAQNIYKSIKNIKFSDDDKKILIDSQQFEYELVENRMREAILKYLSVGSEYRNNLKNISGKTAENLLIETLENIFISKTDLSIFVNQVKLSDLSITRRYTDTIRGEIGKPNIVNLKTALQLKESGELIDLSILNLDSTINQDSSIIQSSLKHKKRKI